MNIIHHLSTLALKQVLDGACKALGLVAGEKIVDQVIGFLTSRFSDQSLKLTRALQQANTNAWRALEMALAGESLWSWLDKAEHRAFREQVRNFLAATPLAGLPGHGPEFRQVCLREMREARKQGLLDGNLEPAALAQDTGQFARFSDPQTLLDAEWRVIAGLAEELRSAGFANLGELVGLRATGDSGPPLLGVALRFFFRREVENDEELYRGLTWVKFESLQAVQEQAFTGLAEALKDHHDSLERMLNVVHGVIFETRDDVKELLRQLEALASRFDVLQREVRPRDSFSIHSEAEQKLVKDLLNRYRALPEEQRHCFPALINGVGKLELAIGAFDAAQREFAQAAALAPDRAMQAETQFNLYGAALERSDLATALSALLEAARLDPPRFAPFPLHKYLPEKILGAGGFGVAFLCRLRHTGGRVVVKTLRSDTLERDLNEVFREAQILETLEHPAIIRLRDCDYADSSMSRPYLVMDYFEGQTLAGHVDEHGPLSPDDLVALLRPVAEALQAAHSRGILHRDIKPANLLVRKDGSSWRVKVIDFGLALKQSVLHSTVATMAGGRTVIGSSIAGTIDYAAPEQLGKWPEVAPGPYTDIYGLGKTSCYALFRTVQPLRKHWKEVPEGLADLLEQCLSEAPKDRLPNMAAFLERLDGLRGSTGKPAGSTSKMDLPRQPAGEGTDAPRRKDDFWRLTPEESAGAAAGSITPIRFRKALMLQGHEEGVLAVAFSPDSRQLLSGSSDRTIRLWDLSRGEQLACLEGHLEKIWSVTFSPDGQQAISASKDKSVRVWDLARGREQRCYANRTNRSVAISGDGMLALSGNISDGMVRLWEVQTGKELRRFKGHMSWVLGLAFAPGRRLALTSSADGTIRLWEIDSGRELRRLQGHSDQVWSVAFTPDGTRALSCSADRTVRLWHLHTGREVQCLADFQDTVWSVANSPDGSLALCDGDNGSVRAWRPGRDDGLTLSLAGHNDKVISVAFSPDGRLAASAGLDRMIIVWELG